MNIKRRRIISAGLVSNLVSGIFFGIGCLLVEHIDRQLFSSEENPAGETTVTSKATTRGSTPPSANKLPSKHLAQNGEQ